jgi:hypothetical protein
MIYVSLAFKQYSNDKLASFTNTAYQQMSDEPQYAFLKPSIDELKVRNEAFLLGIALASRRDVKRIEEREVLRAELLEFLVKNITRRLEDSDQNSVSFITGAGFEARDTKAKKTAKPVITELAMPTNVVGINLPKSGSVTLSWTKSLNANNYALYFREKSETAWHNGSFTDKEAFTYANLKPETIFEFQICALGPNGLTSEPSLPIPVYVT